MASNHLWFPYIVTLRDIFDFVIYVGFESSLGRESQVSQPGINLSISVFWRQASADQYLCSPYPGSTTQSQQGTRLAKSQYRVMTSHSAFRTSPGGSGNSGKNAIVNGKGNLGQLAGLGRSGACRGKQRASRWATFGAIGGCPRLRRNSRDAYHDPAPAVP